MSTTTETMPLSLDDKILEYLRSRYAQAKRFNALITASLELMGDARFTHNNKEIFSLSIENSPIELGKNGSAEITEIVIFHAEEMQDTLNNPYENFPGVHFKLDRVIKGVTGKIHLYTIKFSEKDLWMGSQVEGEFSATFHDKQHYDEVKNFIVEAQENMKKVWH